MAQPPAVIVHRIWDVQPHVWTVGVDWWEIKSTIEVKSIKRAQPLKPPIMVLCTGLDSTARYKIGIDFVRSNRRGTDYNLICNEWVWKVLDKVDPNDTVITNLKWHPSGVQPAKYFMKRRIKFDRLYVSNRFMADTENQYLLLQKSWEYIPVIILVRVNDTNQESLYFPLSHAKFIVVPKYYHPKMGTFKEAAERKKPTRKRKRQTMIPVASMPTFSPDMPIPNTLAPKRKRNNPPRSPEPLYFGNFFAQPMVYNQTPTTANFVAPAFQPQVVSPSRLVANELLQAQEYLVNLQPQHVPVQNNANILAVPSYPDPNLQQTLVTAALLRWLQGFSEY